MAIYLIKSSMAFTDASPDKGHLIYRGGMELNMPTPQLYGVRNYLSFSTLRKGRPCLMRIIVPQMEDEDSLVGWTKRKMNVYYNNQILNSLTTYSITC